MTAARLEVCVDDAEGLQAAISGGADRIELCSALSLGGLTPSAGLMALAARSPIPVRAMIRPRSGDFCYNPDDVAQMKNDIELARYYGLAGVVLGASTPDRRLDHELLAELRNHAAPLSATLHRVVDALSDPLVALETAIALGFDTILTSGGEKTAPAGFSKLQTMIKHAAGRITIMPGAGIRIENVETVLQATGASWLHASCAVQQPVAKHLQKLGFSPANATRTSRKTCAEIAAICQKIQVN